MTLAELRQPERAWVDLLDRLGPRDIWEFTRVIKNRHDKLGGLPMTKARVLAGAGDTPAAKDAKYQIRRDWMLYWVYYFANGRRGTMEELLGFGKSYLAQFLDANYYGGRSIGDTAARTIEVRLGMPEGCMDQPFFPCTDLPQTCDTAPLSAMQRQWLLLLPGLSEDEVREFSIMCHARRRHNLELMQHCGFFASPSRPLEPHSPAIRDIYANRRAWLLRCVDEVADKKRHRMAAMLGLSNSALSHYLSANYKNGTGFSEKRARKFESRLGLPNGTFDTPFDERCGMAARECYGTFLESPVTGNSPISQLISPNSTN